MTYAVWALAFVLSVAVIFQAIILYVRGRIVANHEARIEALESRLEG